MAYKVFKRPSIDLDARPKTWNHRPAKDILVGAIVTNAGEVTKIKKYSIHEDEEQKNVIRFTFKSGGRAEYLEDDTLMSFQ